jgi:hypothetical protein
MKLPVAEFRAQVAAEYDAELANAVAREFSSTSSEISFAEGMDALDRVLLSTRKPVRPASGRTTAPSEDGELEFRKS